MSATPEEKAVIEAAIADHVHGCAPEWCGGSRLDPCRLANVIEAYQRASGPVWVETTMTNCLINDRIRIGAEETTVLRSTHGLWHADNRDPWFPVKWQHVELRLELEAVSGLKQYPPAASIEILCTPERLAVLRIQEGFPGSAVTSSHVD